MERIKKITAKENPMFPVESEELSMSAMPPDLCFGFYEDNDEDETKTKTVLAEIPFVGEIWRNKNTGVLCEVVAYPITELRVPTLKKRKFEQDFICDRLLEEDFRYVVSQSAVFNRKFEKVC